MGKTTEPSKSETMADLEQSVFEAIRPQQDPGCWKRTAVSSLVLFGLTAAVFWPACANGFVNLDDNSYVCNQPQVINGLGWEQLQWVATANVVGNWHPLTMLSLQLDAQLFGPSPFGFHRTSVLIHALNAAMVYLVILSLTGCQWRSVVVACLFALHPLRVESVAWVSERKDVLSGFFFCLTLLAYVHYVRSPSLNRYLLIAFCLILGLCSKAMLVTTPCVLLLLDYWPLRRWQTPSLEEFPQHWFLIFEKLPLLGISAVIALITLASQEPAINSLAEISLSGRIGNCMSGYVAYLSQTFWPEGLRPFYPLRETSTFEFYRDCTLIIALTWIALWQRKRRPYLLVGWLWFLGMLVPVSGLMQTGGQARADRYTYLPHIGLFLAVVWSVAELSMRSRRIAMVATTVIVLYLASLGLMSVQQIAVWRNTEVLFRRVYHFSPDDTMVTQCLINCLVQTQKYTEALDITREALRTADESDQDKMVMIAMLFALQHEHETCELTLTRALKHHPQTAELYSNRGKARAAQGKWSEAAEDFRQASKLSPRSVSFKFYLAHALRKIGNREEADQLFAMALRQSPTWPQSAARDAWRMSTSPDSRERITFWPICLAEQAIEATDGDLPPYLDVLAAAYANEGRFDEAIRTAKQAVQEADGAKQSELSAVIRKRLEYYERHEAYRDVRPGVHPTP